MIAVVLYTKLFSRKYLKCKLKTLKCIDTKWLSFSLILAFKQQKENLLQI